MFAFRFISVCTKNNEKLPIFEDLLQAFKSAIHVPFIRNTFAHLSSSNKLWSQAMKKSALRNLKKQSGPTFDEIYISTHEFVTLSDYRISYAMILTR